MQKQKIPDLYKSLPRNLHALPSPCRIGARFRRRPIRSEYDSGPNNTQ